MSLLNNFKHAPFAYSFLATSNRVRNGAYVLGPQHRADRIVHPSTIYLSTTAHTCQRIPLNPIGILTLRNATMRTIT